MKVSVRAFYIFLAMCLFFGIGLLSCSAKERADKNPIMGLSQEGWNPSAYQPAPDEAETNGVELDSIYFDYDRSSLNKPALQKLKQHAQWLQKHPQALIQIEGFCDERGSEEYNYNLGTLRATSAKNRLVQHGIHIERISLISHGKIPGTSERSMAKNRRASFVVFELTPKNAD